MSTAAAHVPADARAAPRSAARPLLLTRGLSKVYDSGSAVVALDGVDLEVAAGEYVAIVGESGSGKSTLLHLLGCLDRPTRGEYWIGDAQVSTLGADELADVRNALLGFVFQNFQLLPRLSALENVMLPLTYDRGRRQVDPRGAAVSALERMGLADRMDHRPTQLSGGQQQRVAIARALVNSPPVLLADEPTGNLDSATAKEIMAVFDSLNVGGTTVVLITHSADVAAHARRVLEIRDGRIVRETRRGES
ncbi:MAG TPA: ABC transporter ATP-binding protein [Steroidobacteraceae bacterium]|nr:ABC transporter ATP-binding protein [Steroidobacteraceae bacterium]